MFGKDYAHVRHARLNPFRWPLSNSARANVIWPTGPVLVHAPCSQNDSATQMPDPNPGD